MKTRITRGYFFIDKSKKSNLKTVFLILSYTLFTINTAYSQGEANMWYFGTKAGINFNNTPATKFNNGLTNSGNENGEGVATMCDASGNTLFYTDGVTVWNSTGIISGGNATLKGSKSAIESAVAVPQPGTNANKLYYIFTVPCEESSGAYTTGGSKDPTDGLRYTVVNMTTSAGSIAAAQTNIQVTPAGVPVTEALTAVPDNLNTGFWIICHQAGDKTTSATNSNKFYAYHVRPGNVNTTTGVITFTATDIVTSSVGTGITGVPAPPATVASSNSQANMKANSCFTRIAFAFFAKSRLVEVFTFSNTTGALTGPTYSVTNFLGTDPNEVYGLEFSPDGKSLYVSILGQSSRGVLYQFDVTSESTATINTAANTSRRVPSISAPLGELQLGPDGNIYYSFFYTNPIGGGSTNAYVGRITSPNTFPGTFNDTYFTWAAADAGVASKMGLPQIYKGYVAGVGSIEPGTGITKLDSVCVGESFDLKGTYSGTGINWKWNIDANLNLTTDYTIQNPSGVSYATASTYTVTLDFDDATCLYPVSATAQIVVSPIVNTTGTLSCSSPIKGSIISPNGSYTYLWYSDAALTKPIGSGSTNVSLPLIGSGTVYVRAEKGVIVTPTSYSLRASGSKSSEYSGTSFTSSFTASSAIQVNSFQWITADQDWPCPGTPNIRNITISIVDNASSATLWSNTRSSLDLCNASTTYTENPNLLLPSGTYNIIWTVSGTSTLFFANWNSTTVASDANVSIGTKPDYLGNFNYTKTTYTRTAPYLDCSKSGAVSYSCPLPVSLLDFTAQRSELSSSVILNWSTASEKNSKLFYVQRSIDGLRFETIGEVTAGGNSNKISNYYYKDQSVPSENIYYRLLQEDFDNSSIISKTVYVNGSGMLDINVVPNPGNGSFSLIGIPSNIPSSVSVYSVMGRTLYSNDFYKGEVINLESLSKGFYLVRILVGDKEQSIRYIIQ